MRVDIHKGAELQAPARAEIARFRHRIFVKKLGWEVPQTVSDAGAGDSDSAVVSHGDEESDEYDRSDTVYVTLRDDGDAVIGCARLLPATQRYLLADHFPHLVSGDHADAANGTDTTDTTVWELSRFAFEATGSVSGDTGAQGAVKLLRAAVSAAYGLGARRLIGVTYVSLARIFVRLGVATHKLGVAERIDGRWVAAYRIDIDDATLAALHLAPIPVTSADESTPHHETDGGLHLVSAAGLIEAVADVKVDRARRDTQDAADFVGSLALGGPQQDLALAH